MAVEGRKAFKSFLKDKKEIKAKSKAKSKAMALALLVLPQKQKHKTIMNSLNVIEVVGKRS